MPLTERLIQTPERVIAQTVDKAGVKPLTKVLSYVEKVQDIGTSFVKKGIDSVNEVGYKAGEKVLGVATPVAIYEAMNVTGQQAPSWKRLFTDYPALTALEIAGAMAIVTSLAYPAIDRTLSRINFPRHKSQQQETKANGKPPASNN